MTVQEEWERLDEFEKPLLDAYHSRDFYKVIKLIFQAAIIQHRIADWELGVDPDNPPAKKISPTLRALFWLDGRNYAKIHKSWTPTHGSATVSASPTWPSHHGQALQLTTGTTLTVDCTLPNLPAREFAVFALVKPKNESSGRSRLYNVDSEFVKLDYDSKLWIITGNSAEAAEVPYTPGWTVIGHKIGLVDLTAVSSNPVSVVADNPADRFEANRSVRITVGPSFNGELLALAAYTSLATTQSIPLRVNGLLEEYADAL